MHEEIHIVSLVILVRPEHRDEVIRRSLSLPQAECHYGEHTSKFVLVFEADSESALSAHIDEINSWAGVLSTQMCYHHCEPGESLQEVIHYENHAP